MLEDGDQIAESIEVLQLDQGGPQRIVQLQGQGLDQRLQRAAVPALSRKQRIKERVLHLTQLPNPVPCRVSPRGLAPRVIFEIPISTPTVRDVTP